jgi:hypothetical protein
VVFVTVLQAARPNKSNPKIQSRFIINFLDDL